jgi:hypothetical protein
MHQLRAMGIGLEVEEDNSDPANGATEQTEQAEGGAVTSAGGNEGIEKDPSDVGTDTKQHDEHEAEIKIKNENENGNTKSTKSTTTVSEDAMPAVSPDHPTQRVTQSTQSKADRLRAKVAARVKAKAGAGEQKEKEEEGGNADLAADTNANANVTSNLNADTVPLTFAYSCERTDEMDFNLPCHENPSTTNPDASGTGAGAESDGQNGQTGKRADSHKTVLRCLYSYQAKDADELTLHIGQLVTLHSKPEPDWWLGQLLSGGAEGKGEGDGNTANAITAEPLGQIGFFPAKYVTPAV